MILHLEYKNYKTFYQNFVWFANKFHGIFPTVNLHFEKRVNFRPYNFLKRKGLNVEFTIPLSALTKNIVFLANRNRITLVLTAEKPPKKRENALLKQLKVLTTLHDIYGYFDGLKEEYPSLLIANAETNDAFNADVYETCLSCPPKYHCAFTSCLGKTLYVKANGDLYFCPQHLEFSAIGNTKDEGYPFDHETFLTVLKRQIEKRDNCKKDCKYYAACRGGCAMYDTCQTYLSTREEAVNEIGKTLNGEQPMPKENRVLCEALLHAASNGNLYNKK